MLGIGRARKDQLAGTPPWLIGEIDDELSALSRSLKTTELTAVAKTAGQYQLEQARDEVRSIFEVVSCVSTPLEYVFGRNAFGFRVFAQFARLAGPRFQVLMILMWLILKQSPGAQAKIDQLRSALPAARLLRTDHSTLLRRIEMDPGLAKFLSPRRLKAALTNQEKLEILHTELHNYNRLRANS